MCIMCLFSYNSLCNRVFQKETTVKEGVEDMGLEGVEVEDVEVGSIEVEDAEVEVEGVVHLQKCRDIDGEVLRAHLTTVLLQTITFK